MLLMLSGINSFKTIKEVIRGYTGDREAKQIYSEFEKIDVLKFLKFSGNSFKQVFGDGYLRPFELATFRLNNMNEIIQNWGEYIINEEYLPQRGASFLLNNKNQIIYKFFSKDVLGYSSNMRDPLGFLTDLISSKFNLTSISLNNPFLFISTDFDDLSKELLPEPKLI